MTPSTPSAPQPPPAPLNCLEYPLHFSTLPTDDTAANVVEEEELHPSTSPSEVTRTTQTTAGPVFHQVTLFTALFWLFPIYLLGGWLDKKDEGVSAAMTRMRELSKDIKKTPSAEAAACTPTEEPDVRVTRLLLPLLERFFEEKTRLVPPNAQTYLQVQSIAIPTPKGAQLVTRAKVEGGERPPRPSFVPQSNAAAAVTPPGIFCLWPKHNQFLVHYEERLKLKAFSYVELDRLRFAFVAVKELVETHRVFNLNDGSLTGLARRDIKQNSASDPKWSLKATSREGGDGSHTSHSTPNTGSVPGRGGGNVRLHQGTSGNVITAPSAELLQKRKDGMQKRFLKDDLQNMCLTRWPHTPLAKSCSFIVLEEKKQCDLTGSEPLGFGVAAANVNNNKGGKRKGPTYYLAAVDLPLFNKKGGVARFRGEKWWTVKADAESDAAEVAIKALQNLK